MSTSGLVRKESEMKVFLTRVGDFANQKSIKSTVFLSSLHNWVVFTVYFCDDIYSHSLCTYLFVFFCLRSTFYLEFVLCSFNNEKKKVNWDSKIIIKES